MKKYLIIIGSLLFPLSFGLIAQVGAPPSNGGISMLSSGGGGASLTATNTWTNPQTFQGGIVFNNGSIMTDTGNGTITMTDSTASTFNILRLGTSATYPQIQASVGRFTLAKNTAANGIPLGFLGARPTGTCNTSDIWSGGSVNPQFCTGSAAWAWLGPADVPSSPVGGTITPVALSGGTASFLFTVSGTPSTISWTTGSVANGWNCHATNITANAANRANQRVVQTATSPTGASMQNQLVSTGASQAFTAADSVGVTCFAY